MTANAGIISWGDGNGGSVGALSASNSLTGLAVNDFVGISPALPEVDSAFSVQSPQFDDQGLNSAGAVTLSRGISPLVGVPSAANSMLGNMGSAGILMAVDYSESRREWAVGWARESRVTLFSYMPSSLPEITLELDGGLDLTSAAVLDFGEVAVGSPVERTVSVINRGGSPLLLEAPSLAGAGFTISSFTPGTLSPGARTSMTLRFTPSAPGPSNAMLTLGSNAPGNSLFVLNLRGSGLPLPGLPFGTVNATPILTALPSGGTQVAFQAIPGRTYLLQRSFDLLTWPYVRQVVADENGAILYTDTDPASTQAFYRIKAD